MFAEEKQETFPKREERILELWKQNKTFKTSIEQREASQSSVYYTYDGPPFATGLPHYGHLLAGTIKDVVPRYKTMKGYVVNRRFGWDCHGLPVESEIEKEQNLSGAKSIEDYGIANFNEECRKIVLRYTSEWQVTVERMGRWVDFDKTYKTMDITFMESVWWVFKQLFDKGLIYKGYKVMPFSAKLGTPLSNFEAGQNYKDVDDPSLTVTFPLTEEENTSLLVWTTTPWTLPSNLAACVNKDASYVKIFDLKNEHYYILAKARLSYYYKQEDLYEIKDEFLGSSLKGKTYTPPFSYFEEERANNAFQVIVADFVTLDNGTGIVHTAPAFGEDDFYCCKEAGIGIVCPVTPNGIFTSEVPDFEGMFVRDANKKITQHLKERNRIFRQETLRHRYPFCWRSDTPLIYRVVDTWFMSVEKIKPQLIACNNQTKWVPEHVQHGRFGNWLKGARDWAISRNRYWGTPIPIWKSDDGDIHVIGSLEELEELTGKKINDLHRHFIDDLTFEKDGKTFHRISEVFDCWFESGSMPYAQSHYPFENKQEVEEAFPADFIAEGLDQTRGWFYTLMVLSTALFDKPAFKNIIVNGIILSEDGSKMSKRLKNYPDPTLLIDTYGADAIRLYMLHSAAVRAEDLQFSQRGVELVLRQVLIPIWNSYSFLATYARINKWTPKETPSKPTAAIDKWAVSLLNKLIHDVEKGMDSYDLSAAVEPFISFVDQLTNWYIRRCRRRFWSSEMTPDSLDAFQTLYDVLINLTKVAAPFIPFLSDAVFQKLKTDSMPNSVHLCDFPDYDPSSRDENLEQSMAAVQKAVSLGHFLRKENKFKVRQPLPSVHLASPNKELIEFLKQQEHLIKDELNVKQVLFHEDETQFVDLKVKPNFRVLGKRVGKLMPALKKYLEKLSKEDIENFQESKLLQVTIESQDIEITFDEVEIAREVKPDMLAMNEGPLTLVLTTTIDESLALEGLAREIIHHINNLRKEKGLEVTDRIHLKVNGSENVAKCLDEYAAFIQKEILALSLEIDSSIQVDESLNNEPISFAINKA
jgi:isoleucyl-tRNA synthetase